MRIQLSDHFHYSRLIRFVLPTIVMMVFTSIYTVVDGLFVSNFAGKTAFAAVNLIMPILMGMGAVGFLIGTGGSAVISRTLGEGNREKACQYFSMMIYVTIGIGIMLSVVGLIFLRPISQALGAEGQMLEDCVTYGTIWLIFQTAFILQCAFQSFFVTAEKPKLGLYVTVAAGMSNVVLDALFVAVFQWGLIGAVCATVISQMVGGIFPLVYFARKNDSLLRLTRARIEWKILLRVCTNGSSELMTNLSASLVNILYNFQLMAIAGENGVAAYGVIMYVNFIFTAVYFGYAVGCAPIISYHFGADNHAELKNLFRKSLIITAVLGLAMMISSQILASPLAKIFVGYDAELFELTCHGFRIYAFSFLLCGFNIFSSAFFTALNNGAVSAGIAFLRTLVFQLAAILILPGLLGIDGVWLAIVAAEILALTVSVYFFISRKKQYHYA